MTTTATQLAAALEAGWACDTSPDEMTAAAAELRRLDAEVEALRKDAERYQWLRDQRQGDWGICGWHDSDEWAWDTRPAEVVDAAIDAAMKGAANG